jgi:hypothetical protein
MNKNNNALFIFGFVFYFIGDLATTYIALSNGMPESGLVRIITRYNFSIMVFIKTIFFTALYFFDWMPGEAGQLPMWCYSWAGCRDGNDGYVDECSGYLG